MLALIPFLLAVFDLGAHFAEPEAWRESAVDFAVDHRADGFQFASQERNAVNCLGVGRCTWHGMDVYETRIYYGKEGAERLELSLYNRGDAFGGSSLGRRELEEMLAAVAKNLGATGRAQTPEKRKLKGDKYVFTRVFKKTDPPAELAWGVTGAKASSQTVDFVRLTLRGKAAVKAQATTSPAAGHVTQAKIRAHVTRNAEGDVWIRDVPMVDQGQKGYCAAAVAERILRYYGNDVDEHEIAQAAGTTAHGGTSVEDMKETVRKVGSRCRLGFDEVVSMGGDLKSIEKDFDNYNRMAKSMKEPPVRLSDHTRGHVISVGEAFAEMKPKVLKKARVKDPRYKKFLAGVKSAADRGIPVAWSVTLGMFPEPGIPQNAGGHMRLIIGYNAKKGEILYTDTWGAGHELKRMPEDWAFTITHEAFYLRPL